MTPETLALERSIRIMTERNLAALVQIMDDVLTADDTGQDKRGRAVINLSRGWFRDLSYESGNSFGGYPGATEITLRS
jgi:hypothetical protein